MVEYTDETSKLLTNCIT